MNCLVLHTDLVEKNVKGCNMRSKGFLSLSHLSAQYSLNYLMNSLHTVVCQMSVLLEAQNVMVAFSKRKINVTQDTGNYKVSLQTLFEVRC